MLVPFSPIAEGKIIEAFSSIQKAIDEAGDGDEITLSKGEYLLDKPLVIKEKQNLSLSTRGKVVFTNKKGAAITITDSNISIKGISFIRNEIAVEVVNSAVAIRNCQWKKNRIGVTGLNSILVLEHNRFQNSFLASILLLEGNNVLEITPSNSFLDDYVDVFSSEVSSENFNSNFQGNKISLGKTKD